MEQSTKISCPQCGNVFNVEDVLAHQIEEKYRQKLNERISGIKSEYEKKEISLVKKEQELKQKQNDIAAEVEKQVKIEALNKEKEIKKRVEQDYELQLKTLSEEAVKANKEVQEYKKTAIENEQLKRKLEDQKQELQLDFQKQLSVSIREEAEKISKREAEKAELPLKEKDMLINSLKEQIDNLKRTGEQGSEQAQGEAQELLLQEALQTMFPFDLIEPVGKGIKGADVIQTVRNKIGMDCGKIIFESKRTKSFVEDWIPKLKADAVLVKADISVIVTEVLPEGMDKMGMKNDVWICSNKDYKGLILALRESLIKINEAFSSQTNKGEKMQMLYDYLMSNEFMLQIGSIVDGFSNLQQSYLKERNAMEKIWKEREKQLQQILLNTNHFIGSVKGIGGSSMSNLKMIGNSENIMQLE